MTRASQDVVKVPRVVWESVLETMDTLADEAELRSIRRGIDDLRRGRVLTKSEFLRHRPHLSR